MRLGRRPAHGVHAGSEPHAGCDFAWRAESNGSITHSFAVRTPFGVLKSDSIAPGQKGGLTVDLIKPGIYTFYCPLGHHGLKGMQGSVVIESP